MKRTLALFLALLMALSLCACGGDNASPSGTAPAPLPSGDTQSDDATEEQTEPPAVTLTLGEAASTDVAEFTLQNCQFTYYLNNIITSSDYVTPTTEPNDRFAASVGHCLVSVTFAVTNKDRAGSIDFFDSFGNWDPKWTVSYNGTDYPVRGFDSYDSSNKDGSRDIDLTNAAILNGDGTVKEVNIAHNRILKAGATEVIRAFGIIGVEPESLDDGFDFSVRVPNSGGEYEQFTYTIPARQ